MLTSIVKIEDVVLGNRRTDQQTGGHSQKIGITLLTSVLIQNDTWTFIFAPKELPSIIKHVLYYYCNI